MLIVAPSGSTKELTRFEMPARSSTHVIVSGRVPLDEAVVLAAEASGDRSTYSDVTYTREGEFIRIEALRYSEKRKRASPFSIVVGPSSSGKWLIYEELSESRQ